MNNNSGNRNTKKRAKDKVIYQRRRAVAWALSVVVSFSCGVSLKDSIEKAGLHLEKYMKESKVERVASGVMESFEAYDLIHSKEMEKYLAQQSFGDVMLSAPSLENGSVVEGLKDSASIDVVSTAKKLDSMIEDEYDERYGEGSYDKIIDEINQTEEKINRGM